MNNRIYVFAIITVLSVSFICLCGCEYERQGQFRKTFDGGFNSIGMEFVYIKPGKFIMGSPIAEIHRGKNEIQHQVILKKGFYMQITEVTQAQWKAVMGMDNNPSEFRGDNLPVECVSWNTAQEFIKKLNKKERKGKYRLPTEAEWEYACRAGTETAYYWGLDDAKEYCWYYDNSDQKTHPVATKKPNCWRLYDMSGNVSEWCEDWYDEGQGFYDRVELFRERNFRVLRGGSWYSTYRRGNWRSAGRGGTGPDCVSNSVGFRVVRTSDR